MKKLIVLVLTFRTLEINLKFYTVLSYLGLYCPDDKQVGEERVDSAYTPVVHHWRKAEQKLKQGNGGELFIGLLLLAYSSFL